MNSDCAHAASFARTTIAPLVTFAASFFLTACGGGVSQPSGPSPLSITTASLPDGITQTVYNQVLNATGGERPYTWKIASGKLPTGVVLATHGVLAGTPTEAGSFEFTAQVTDAAAHSVSRTFTFKFIEGLVITSSFEALLWWKEPYSQTLTATGGTKPYTWSATRDLPPGLTLSSDGVLSGTPTDHWHWVFDVHVRDAGPPVQTASHWFDVFVNQRLEITTSRLPAARPNVPYRAIIASNVGYTWIITAGSLPSGLNLNASTGEISGIPTVEGIFNFTLQVTANEHQVVQTVTKDLSLTIASDLGRNDEPAMATPISNGTFRASISPFADPVAGPANPDHDFYELTANPGSIVTVETEADSLILGLMRKSAIDTVLEIVNAAGNRFSTCRAQWDQSFNHFCLNDDIDQENTQDSRLEFQVPGTANGPVTFFVHVFSWDGNARPDYVYDLIVSGAN